jgi:hypothetical protein
MFCAAALCALQKTFVDCPLHPRGGLASWKTRLECRLKSSPNVLRFPPRALHRKSIVPSSNLINAFSALGSHEHYFRILPVIRPQSAASSKSSFLPPARAPLRHRENYPISVIRQWLHEPVGKAQSSVRLQFNYFVEEPTVVRKREKTVSICLL